MDYQFSFTPDQQAIAKCSMEHEAFGHWLTEEVANNAAKLSAILNDLEALEKRTLKQKLVKGDEYQLKLTQEDAIVYSSHIGEDPDNTLEERDNPLFDHEPGFDEVQGEVDNDQSEFQSAGFEPDELSLDDQNGRAMCGLEDFKELMLAWQDFLKSK